MTTCWHWRHMCCWRLVLCHSLSAYSDVWELFVNIRGSSFWSVVRFLPNNNNYFLYLGNSPIHECLKFHYWFSYFVKIALISKYSGRGGVCATCSVLQMDYAIMTLLRNKCVLIGLLQYAALLVLVLVAEIAGAGLAFYYRTQVSNITFFNQSINQSSNNLIDINYYCWQIEKGIVVKMQQQIKNDYSNGTATYTAWNFLQPKVTIKNCSS